MKNAAQKCVYKVTWWVTCWSRPARHWQPCEYVVAKSHNEAKRIANINAFPNGVLAGLVAKSSVLSDDEVESFGGIGAFLS